MFKSGKGFVNLCRRGRLPLIWGDSPIDKVFNAISTSQCCKNSTRFKEITNDIMKGAERGVSFLLGNGNKRGELRVFGFLFQRGKAEGKIYMSVRVELLESGDSCKDFRGELGVKVSFPVN